MDQNHDCRGKKLTLKLGGNISIVVAVVVVAVVVGVLVLKQGPDWSLSLNLVGDPALLRHASSWIATVRPGRLDSVAACIVDEIYQ